MRVSAAGIHGVWAQFDCVSSNDLTRGHHPEGGLASAGVSSISLRSVEKTD